MINPRHFLAGLSAAFLMVGASLHATPVTVQELGIGANETVWINSSSLGNYKHVYAGVVNLSVDSVATAGFCIDPWHWSNGNVLPYDEIPLANAPKSAIDSTPNPMGAAAAKQIEQLWSQYEIPALSDNVTAAALQIEIWKIVDAAVSNGTFQLLSIDGSDSAATYAKIAAMDTFLANNPNAPVADLAAVSGAGQDYVIPNTNHDNKVPDTGATVALLGCALAGLVSARKRFLGR